MKNRICAALLAAACVFTASAWDLKDLLNRGNNTETTTTTETPAATEGTTTSAETVPAQGQQQSGGILSGLFGGSASSSSTSASTSQSEGSSLSSLVTGIANVIAGSNLKYSDLVGTWTYVQPAVSFESENLLQKAGGAVATAALIEKMAPYYEAAGVTSMTITFAADSTFTATVRRLSPSGSVTVGADNNYTFTFRALGGRLPVGRVNAFVARSNLKNMSLTFDAKGLIKVVQAVAGITGNSTLKTLSSLLGSYDGLNIGAEFAKQK